MLKQFSEDQLLGKPLSERQKLELLALMDRPDHDMDVSDIPEVRELPPGTKLRRVQPSHYIELSDELHAYFSAVATRQGVPLNAVIDDVLSKEIAVAEATK